MGIPFGCGSVLLLAVGGLWWQFPPSGHFLLTTLLTIIAAIVLGAGALIASEWLRA